MSIEFKPVDVTEADKNKQESKKLAWVNEAMAGVKADLKQLTYEVNPFIKKVEGKEYWEYDIDKVRDYLNKLQNINNFQDIANISWEKTRGAYTVKWIMAVQIALKALWVAPDLTIDWVLATQKNFSSSETVKAIRKFQADNGLDVTGVPYEPTIKKLLAKLGGAVSGAVSESSINNPNADGKIKLNQALDGGGGQGQGDKVVPEKLSASQMFEESPIGKTFKKLSESAAWLSNELVQAWKKQAENYFKDKNPQEYQMFSSLDWDGWKGYYYDPRYKDIQIGTFKNKLLQEGIVLQNDKVLFITSRNQTGEQPLFEKQPPQKDTQWNQVEVSEKTDQELTKEVIDFFSQPDPKNPQTTIFDTLAHWNGKDFEELGKVLSKLSLDGLAGKTNALGELMTNLNTIVALLNQNKRFMLFNGAQRKKDVLEQIAGIISKVWGIPEWELNDYKDLGALLQNKKTNTSGTKTPDNKANKLDDKANKLDDKANKLDDKDKLLNKENISFSAIMSRTGKDEFNTAIYGENEANLKFDEKGNYYFLIGNEKYYKPHEDGKGNLIAQIPDAKYYEKTKDWELTVISFGKLNDWFISQPDFELRSDGKRKKPNEVEWE